MPRQIWNEGRVVGFSAYEVYLKHAMSIDPNHEPATEKEWLASMMSMGSSMLLRIGTTSETYIDVPFPADSRLCAANNILASVFTGEGYVGNAATSEHVWCTKVTDYGPLIANSSSRSPSTVGVQTAENIRTKDENISLSDIEKSSIREYMKIVDGIIIQPGTWVTNSNKPPQKDFTPELAQVPTLRIAFSEPVTQPFFILLTGFTNRSVVTGVTGFFDPQRPIDVGYDSAVNTQSPQDGDFLGPWAFPWAAKVIFSVPSAYISYFMNNKYTRELPDGSEAVTVKSDAIIDMKQNYTRNSSDYYTSEDIDAPISADINEINISGEDAAIIASYMHTGTGELSNIKLPPALYGALVSQGGKTKFIPLDTIAPGSLKLYHGYMLDGSNQVPANKAKVLESIALGATGFVRDDALDASSYVVSQLDGDGEIIPVSNDSTININNLMTTCTDWVYFFTHRSTDGELTTELLQSVDSVIYEQLASGYVSAELIQQYGLTKDEYDDVKSKFTTYLSFFGSYWDGLSNPDDYVAFISGPESLQTVAGPSEKEPQMSFMIVNKKSGQVAYMSSESTSLGWGGLDFTTGNNENNTYDTNLTDFLGTWWNTSGNKLNVDNNYIVLPADRHPYIRDAAASYAATFYQDSAYTPYCPEGYPDFRYYFDSITVSDFLSRFNKTEDDINIHADFKGLSLQQLLRAALTQDVTKPNDITNRRIRVAAANRYYYKKSVILAAANSKDFSQCYSTLKVIIPQPKQTIFDMRIWSIHTRTSSNASWSDITQIANRVDTPIFAAVGQSGHNTSTSISLVDGDNIRLNTSGTSGTIECDTVTWSNLLIALNMNQRLDVLAGAMFRRNAQGINYLIMADGTRFYISKTKPTGDDIEDGSIGIGWEEE